MDFGFNWVDFLIIGALGLFALEALGKSLILETLDLISFLLAIIISFSFYNYPARIFENWFKVPHGLSLVIGFMFAWFLTEMIFYVTLRIFLPRIQRRKIVGEKYLATIPAILRGLIFISLILVLIATFPVQPRIKKLVQDSYVGSMILRNAYALEEPTKNVFGGVSEDNLTFLTIKPKTNESVNLGFQISDYTLDTLSETEMLNLVNQERSSRGLNILKFDSTLRTVARDHSADMFKRGYFSHYTPEGQDVANRADKYDVKYMVIGENLAFAPTLVSAHKGLMNSPGHRENILSPDFNKVGIGVMDGGIYGKMFTQVFSD